MVIKEERQNRVKNKEVYNFGQGVKQILSIQCLL